MRYKRRSKEENKWPINLRPSFTQVNTKNKGFWQEIPAEQTVQRGFDFSVCVYPGLLDICLTGIFFLFYPDGEKSVVFLLFGGVFIAVAVFCHPSFFQIYGSWQTVVKRPDCENSR